jgi:hypothetical protein
MKPGSFKALTLVILYFILFYASQTISGQAENLEKPEKKNLKNSVKLNLTNPMIFGDHCYMIGYETPVIFS